MYHVLQSWRRIEAASKVTFLLMASMVVLSCPDLRAQNLTWRDRGNRFEGIVEVPNGRRDYEVLAFFGYDAVRDASPDGELHLMFYLPPAAQISDIAVKEIHSDTLYAAQFKREKLQPIGQNWQATGQWPLRDVIKPANVKLTNLGVVIRLNSQETPGEIAPAFLYTAERPKRIDRYSLSFVSNRELSKLTCVVSQGALRQKCSVGGSLSGKIETSEPVEISFDAAGLQPGDAMVELDGTLANMAANGTFSARIHFLHAKLP